MTEQINTENEFQNISENNSVDIILKKIRETKNQVEKEKLLNLAVDKIIILAGLREKYDKSTQNIKDDTKKLIKYSVSNRLNIQLWEYNIDKFDWSWKRY